MPLLFSYGTLQEERVQRATFGRLLQGQRDQLPGFALTQVKIEDPKFIAASGKTHYANATRDDSGNRRVMGTVFEVTEAELAAADTYERPAVYTRIAVVLASGKHAWAYVHAPSIPATPHREFEELIEALRADGLEAEAHVLRTLLRTAWTTSSEFMGEVGLELRKINATASSRLSANAKNKLDAGLAVVRGAWPDFRR